MYLSQFIWNQRLVGKTIFMTVIFLRMKCNEFFLEFFFSMPKTRRAKLRETVGFHVRRRSKYHKSEIESFFRLFLKFAPIKEGISLRSGIFATSKDAASVRRQCNEKNVWQKSRNWRAGLNVNAGNCQFSPLSMICDARKKMNFWYIKYYFPFSRTLSLKVLRH